MDIRLIIALVGAAVALLVYRDTRRVRKMLEESSGKLRATTKSVGNLLDEYRKFKVAFESAYDMMVITDYHGTILFGNDSVKRVTGYDVGEVIGKKAGTLWGKQMPTEYYRTMWHTLTVDREAFHGRLKNRHKHGYIYEAEVTISPVFGDNKRTVEFFVGVERPVID